MVRVGNRAVSRQVIESEEIVTPYTLKAEEKTQNFTAIPINTNITRLEQRLRFSDTCHEHELEHEMYLNRLPDCSRSFPDGDKLEHEMYVNDYDIVVMSKETE